ncbi:MAG: hypothetical protein AAFR88_04380 [Pseudomonadota bacterium]
MAFLLALLIVICQASALLFAHSLHSIDGVLQTWFALDNFAAGNQLGTQFQSYLGITMILALLPAFLAFGGTLYASSVAATIAVIAGAFCSAYFVVWLIRFVPRDQRWLYAVLIVFGFYFALPAIAAVIGYPYPLSFDPGVSLRSVRGFLPFFVVPFFIIFTRLALRGKPLFAGIGLGTVSGVACLWSNDAGIPLVIALGIGLVAALAQRHALLGKTLFAWGTSGAATACLVLLAVTHGEPWPWLQYNFSDVRGDQFWYFGPWDRNTRVFTLWDLHLIVSGANLLSLMTLVSLASCVVLVILRRLRGRGSCIRDGSFIFVGASLVGTALLPQIGGHVAGSYNDITVLLGAFAPIILLQRWLFSNARSWLHAVGAWIPWTAAGLASMVMAGAQIIQTSTTISASDRTVYARELGFYVTPKMGDELQAMRRLSDYWAHSSIPRDRRILSVYTSALDIAADAQSTTPVGSLIHALGPKYRNEFEGLVAARAIPAVTTIAPDYSGWEGWNWRANWGFFRGLREHYQPIARNDQHVLWVQSDSAAKASSPSECSIKPQGNAKLIIEITSAETGIASIELERAEPFGKGRSAILTVTERSPETLQASEPAWADFPRYGVANKAQLALAAPVTKGRPTQLSLEVLDGSPIGNARCSSSVFAPIDFATLPGLPKGIAQHLEGVRP